MAYEREDIDAAYQAIIRGGWKNKFSIYPKIGKLFLNQVIRWHKKIEQDFKNYRGKTSHKPVHICIARDICSLILQAEREILSNQFVHESPKVTEQKMKLTASSLGKSLGYFFGAIRFGLNGSLFNVDQDYIKRDNFGILRTVWSFGFICKQEGINLEILSRQVGIIAGESQNNSGKFLTKKLPNYS